MKIQRKKTFFTRTHVLIIAAILLFALVGAAFWWFFIHQAANNNGGTAINSIDYSPATEEEKQDSAAAKERALQESENQTSNSATPTTDSVIVTINRAGQAAAGQNVAVRTQIDGATSGTCDVTFTKANTTTITKTFNIATEATTVTCNGDIPASDFNANGEWEMSVVAKTSGVASKPATQKVTVQK